MPIDHPFSPKSTVQLLFAIVLFGSMAPISKNTVIIISDDESTHESNVDTVEIEYEDDVIETCDSYISRILPSYHTLLENDEPEENRRYPNRIRRRDQRYENQLCFLNAMSSSTELHNNEKSTSSAATSDSSTVLKETTSAELFVEPNTSTISFRSTDGHLSITHTSSDRSSAMNGRPQNTNKVIGNKTRKNRVRRLRKKRANLIQKQKLVELERLHFSGENHRYYQNFHYRCQSYFPRYL